MGKVFPEGTGGVRRVLVRFVDGEIHEYSLKSRITRNIDQSTRARPMALACSLRRASNYLSWLDW